MDEYISREAVFQVVHGIARGIADRDTEALKAKDMKAFYMAKGAKEILDSVDTDLCYIPAADVQSIVYAHKTINVGRRSYCSNCGKLAIMEDFCSKCGAKVKDGNSTEERKEYHDNTTSFLTEPPFNYCGEEPVD